MVPKADAYRKGARPVIYDSIEEAKEYLDEQDWWRIVRLDYSHDDDIIDWTHEREWRILGEFRFELNEIVVTLYAQDYGEFVERCEGDKDISLSELGGITVLDTALL